MIEPIYLSPWQLRIIVAAILAASPVDRNAEAQFPRIYRKLVEKEEKKDPKDYVDFNPPAA